VLKSKKFVLPMMIVCALALLVAVPAEASDLSVGYVNMQEIAQSHPAIVEAEQNLQQQAGEMQQDMQADMQDLDQEEDAEEMQQIQQSYQQQMQELEAQQEQALEDEVMPDLESAREDLGIDVIVIDEAVVSGGEDVTDDVLNFFEESDDIDDVEQPEGQDVLDTMP